MHSATFVDIPDNSAYTFENLPYGVFSTADNVKKRIGVAIGAQILDLLAVKHLFTGPLLSEKQSVFSEETLNQFIGLSREYWLEARLTIQFLLSNDNPMLRDDSELCKKAFVAQSEATMHLPAEIGDYTDFYSSIYHATNVGTMFRGKDNALMDNWKWLPVAYHGRASSVVVSGTAVRRPWGQIKAEDDTEPNFVPSRLMDFELEMAFFDGGAHFRNGSDERLECSGHSEVGHFSMGRHDGSPSSVHRQRARPNFDIDLTVDIKPEGSDQSFTICRTNFRHLYWTLKQQLAHHTSNGCNVRPGDLMGSGTLSGPSPDSLGCLLELSWKGTKPVHLGEGGEMRKFLKDNDEVIISGSCKGPTGEIRIGFGECRGKLLPAHKRRFCATD
uniref:Fumarylacetoacetase n=1 Tax=Globodera rostochiensis TaxID=31243 RepID=A0A914GUP0_GLORO